MSTMLEGGGGADGTRFASKPLPVDQPDRLNQMLLSKIVEVSTSRLVQWSPDGTMLAMAKGKRLVIRSPSMDIIQFFNCVGAIEYIEWSPNSQCVLTGIFQNQVVQVWQPSDSAWRCKITDDIGGIAEACWSPCSTRVVTLADFNLHLCIWSLVDESKIYVPNPKSIYSQGISFTKDGRFAAVLQRKSCKDSVGIFSIVDDWKPVRHFDVASQDSAAISWSPTSEALCVIDTALSYLVLVYSPDGSLLKKYSAYEDALGIRSHSWSPDGNFLSIGSFDGAVRLLDSASWSVVSTVRAESLRNSGVDDEEDDAGTGGNVEDTPSTSQLFEEVYDHELSDVRGVKGSFVSIVSEGAAANGAHIKDPDDDTVSKARTIVSSCLVCVTRLSSVSWRDLASEVQSAQNKAQTLSVGAGSKSKRRKAPRTLPALGISHISWSSRGEYFAVQNEHYPSVLWIWKVGQRNRIAAVVLKARIRDLKWHHKLPFLAICAGESARSFIWTPSGILDVCVPGGGLVPQRLLWAVNTDDDGIGFCLAGSSSACSGVLTTGPNEEEEN